MSTSDGPGDSLADQAAAWIPPWDRPSPRTEPPAPPADAAPADAPDAPAPDPASPPPDAQATPDTQPAAPPPPQHAAEPDPQGGAEPEPMRSGPADPKPAAADEPDEAAPVPDEQETGPGRPAEPVPDATEAGEDQPTALMDPAELRTALEAIMLVVDEPVREIVLAQVLEQPVERITEALEALAAEYTEAGRGFDLRRAAGGWRLYTRPEQAAYVERFVLDGQQARLTQAALETVAVVAYRQPVTRSRISAIRGVNCDGVIRTLLSRGLVQESGTEPETGAHLYQTTTLFLEKLGLDSVDQLPPLAPFLPQDVEEIADAQR